MLCGSVAISGSILRQDLICSFNNTIWGLQHGLWTFGISIPGLPRSPATTLCKQLRWSFSDLLFASGNSLGICRICQSLRLCALPCHSQQRRWKSYRYFYLIFLCHIAPLDWWLWLLFEHKVSMPYIKHVKQAGERLAHSYDSSMSQYKVRSISCTVHTVRESLFN